MADALAFTITIDGNAYASVNKTTRSGFDLRKSPIYKAVRKAVKGAAEEQMARVGWTKATCDCFVIVTRIMPKSKAFDAGNMGKPELDGLTDAGVWDDDVRANPPMYFVRTDPGAQHRVAIVVQKLFYPRETTWEVLPESDGDRLNRKEANLPAVVPRVRRRDPIQGWRPGMPVPPGYAVENGCKLVKVADAIERMR